MGKAREHTPGPWEAYPVGDNSVVVRSRETAGLVTVIKRTAYRAKDEADAHLIEAAPDLLEALKVCAADLDAWSRSYGERVETLDAMDAARATIAKAEGREVEV